jgi:hypothetical protein
MKPISERLSRHGLYLLCIILFQTCQAQKKSEMNSAVSASEIIAALEKNKGISLENKTINGDLDFSLLSNNSSFNDFFSQYQLSRGLYFKNCRFTGKVIFTKSDKDHHTLGKFLSFLSFINCGFDDEVLAKSLDISGMLTFNDCTFSKLANFEDLNALHDVSFIHTMFNAETRFHNSVFHRKLTMMRSDFANAVSFQGSGFYGDVQLSDIKFLGYADFGICNFHQSVFFNYSVFQNKAIFNQCIFDNRAEWNNAKLYKLEMINSQFRGTTQFKQAEVSGNAKLQKLTFYVQEVPFDELKIEAANKEMSEVVSLYKKN